MQKMPYKSFCPAQSNIVVDTWRNRLNEKNPDRHERSGIAVQWNNNMKHVWVDA